jgi:hypothetical protein
MGFRCSYIYVYIFSYHAADLRLSPRGHWDRRNVSDCGLILQLTKGQRAYFKSWYSIALVKNVPALSRVYLTTNNINPLKTKRNCFMQGLSAYRAGNTLHFGYKNQSLNVL